jgi:hypothetical protein
LLIHTAGAGKTTTMRALSDLEEPQDGLDAETWAKDPAPGAALVGVLAGQALLPALRTCALATSTGGPKTGPCWSRRSGSLRSARDFEVMWASGEPGWPNARPERDHIRRMLELGRPRPAPEHECLACTAAKRVTGYQRIGPLVPPPKPAAPPPIERKRV